MTEKGRREPSNQNVRSGTIPIQRDSPFLFQGSKTCPRMRGESSRGKVESIFIKLVPPSLLSKIQKVSLSVKSTICI
jgi:hypothetical protein